MYIAENEPGGTIATILKIETTFKQQPPLLRFPSSYQYHNVLETSKGVDFFKRMPIEITTSIVSGLDVRSVIALRSVNKCAKAAIESFTEATAFLQDFFPEFLLTGSNGWETFVQLGLCIIFQISHCLTTIRKATRLPTERRCETSSQLDSPSQLSQNQKPLLLAARAR